MQITLETLSIASNRCPVGISLRTNIAVEDKLQVSATLHMRIK